MRPVAPLSVCIAWVVACGAPSVRNEVPSSRTQIAAGAQAHDSATYVYVAKRTRASVGLAEARNLSFEVAREAVERLAEGLDSCVRDELRRGGTATRGAARIAVHVDAQGAVRDAAVRVSSEPGAAKLAALCLVVPMRMMVFPPGDDGERGLAVEALWTAQ